MFLGTKIWVAVLVTVTLLGVVNGLTPSEKSALTDLQAQWGEKLGWSTPVESACSPSGAWRGLLCYNDSVVNMYLGGNGLTGTLPASIGGLSSLQGMGLAFNALGGTLPPSMGDLKDLNVLELSSNSLQGQIPPAVFALPNIARLALDNNFFTGSLPQQTPSKSLVGLDAYRNLLEGILPDWICGLGEKQFDVSGNAWKCPEPSCCQNGSNPRCGTCL